MNKLRSDSTWTALAPEQKQTLEGRLFEENLSYRDALERVEKEFGIKASLNSLSEFYRRLERERKESSLKETLGWAMEDKGKKTPEQLEVLQAKLLKLVALAGCEMAMAGPDKIKVKEVKALMKLLLQNRLQNTREGRLALETQRDERAAGLAVADELRSTAKFRQEMEANKGVSYEEMKEFWNFATQGLSEKQG